jgi:enoyl-CoA hydratase/carnithine racemase
LEIAMTVDTQPAVKIQVDEGVGTLELNRPKTFNALSSDILNGIGRGLSQFESDPAVRVVLLKASGKNFCTGADLKEAGEKLKDPVLWAEFIQGGVEILGRLEQSRLPVIIEIQGLCLAGGLELMLCADVVFAANSAKIGDQHAQFGLLPGFGGSQRLPRVVGSRRALDLMYSAQWLSAEDARAIGLVNHVVDDAELSASALAYCKTLATRSPTGISLMKELVHKGMDTDLVSGLALETEKVLPYMDGPDAAEGLAAFSERRPPVFK